jgi:hypothetical protein
MNIGEQQQQAPRHYIFQTAGYKATGAKKYLMGSTTTVQEMLSSIIDQHHDQSPSQYDCLSITFSRNWDGAVCKDGFSITQIADPVAAYYSAHVCPVHDVTMSLEHYDPVREKCRLRIDLKFTRTPGTQYVAYPFLPFTEQSEIRYYC